MKIVRNTLLAVGKHGAIAIILAIGGCMSPGAPPDIQLGDIKAEDTRLEDGSLWRRQHFYIDSDGDRVRHGLEEFWHRSGHMYEQVEYRHGKLDGLMRRWYSDGTMQESGTWNKNRRIGDWTWWQPTGGKMADAHYENDRIVGSKRYWHGDQVTLEEVYNGDITMRQLIQYGPGGRKIFEGNYVWGRRHGAFTWWDAQGQLRAKGEYRNGKPWNGICGDPGRREGGSGGPEKFGRYQNGRLIERVDFEGSMDPP